MSKVKNVQNEEITTDEVVELSIGKLLQNARIKAGLSLVDAADYLKLHKNKLIALESDDFSSLPGLSFARGLALGYARYLKIDDSVLLPCLDKYLPRSGVFSSKENIFASQEKHKTNNSSCISPYSVFVVLALILFVAALSWWFFIGLNKHQKALPVVTESKTTADFFAENKSASAVIKAASSPAISASESINSTIGTSSVATLELTASADVWVSVYDAKGTRLINGVLVAGATKTVAGVPPLKIKTANRRRIILKYNGHPVDLMNRKGQKARMSIELK